MAQINKTEFKDTNSTYEQTDELFDAIIDSNNESTYDSGWVTLTNEVKYRIKNGHVTVVGIGVGTAVGNGVYTTVATLPTNARPTHQMYFAPSWRGGNYAAGTGVIYGNGEIGIYLPTSTTSTSWAFSVTFPI